MQYILKYAIPGLWGVFYGIWGLAGLRVKRAQRAESLLSSIVIQGATIVGYLLVLFAGRVPLGPLAWRFMAETPAAVIAGTGLETLGIVFALIARFHLGGNWSGTVTIKEDHQLLSTGPYALVRHPIYTGILFGLLGTVIAYGDVWGWVGFALVLAAHLQKIRVEERFLLRQFGVQYEQYRQRVKILVPFVL